MNKKYLSFFVIFSVLIVILLGIFVWAAASQPTNVVFDNNVTGVYDEGIFNLSWTASAQVVNYSIYISTDGGTTFYTKANNNTNTGYSFSNTTEANYTFIIEAVNSTNNNANSTNVSMFVDRTAPAITLPVYTNLTAKKNTATLTLNISVIDATSGLTGSACIVDVNGTNQTFSVSGGWCNTTSGNLTNLADGNRVINVYVNDTVNILGLSNSFFVSIDTTAPSPSLTKTSSGQTSLELSISGKEGTCTVDRSGATISDSTVTETGLSCGNSYSYIVTCTDSAGNAGSSSATSFSTTGCSSGTGGTTTPQPKKASYSFSKITPGNVSIMKNFDKETGIKEIQINVNNPAQNVKISVIKYDGLPASVSVEKTGKVYQYLEIKTENLGNKLEKAVVIIKVKKTWISENNLDKDRIALFKFNENSKEWNELSTVYTNSDDTYDFFEVELTSFSYFAISEKTVVEEEGEEVVVDTTPSEDLDEETKGLTWLWIVIAVLVVLVAVAMNRKKINFLKK